MIAAGDRVVAANGRNARAVTFVESPNAGEAGEPIMAIVSLPAQRITVYDAKGWILQAPVSSGQKGRETPAGIFSVIQKEAEHYSNLYDDAYMPHMQRITWSGIALHGGPLPGHPASHGCVRMPYDFARRLFGMTKLGMRVVVAPSDVAPVEIVYSAPFPTQPGAGSIAATLAAEAHEAASKADQARVAATTASREAARATMRVAENLKVSAEAQLAAADPAVASAGSVEAKEQGEDAKAVVAAKAAELETQWAAAKSELQRKFDAVASAREATVTAEKARVEAAEAARKAALDLELISIGLHQPQDSASLCPAGLPAHPGEPSHDPGCRSSDRHACLHRHRAHRQRRGHAMERGLAERRRRCGRAARFEARAPQSGRRANGDRP